MSMKKGTLYGIGVGPGDPELITVKAVNILKRIEDVFTAASVRKKYSLAVNIAKPYILENARVMTLNFSMVKDREETFESWNKNARLIIDVLESGRDAVFLTLGDPMTYSTFGYVMKSILKISPDSSIITIPGITSYQAAAARINTPLVEAEESLLLTSGAYGSDCLRRCAGNVENLAMLKAYRNVDDNIKAIEEADMIDNSRGISRCSREGEEIIDNVRSLMDRKPDYWTLILAKKN